MITLNEFWKTIAAVCSGLCIIIAGGASPVDAADKKEAAVDKTHKESQKNIKQIIFEEQKIEGKIRRPQMVLIKADQRPIFSSMVLASVGRNDNIADFVDQSIIDKTPNQDAFQFDGTRISNYVK
jgi:hypothetical protein